MRQRLPQSPSCFLILLLIPLVCYGISTVNHPSSEGRKSNREATTSGRISSLPTDIDDADDDTFRRSGDDRSSADAGDLKPDLAEVDTTDSSDTETESDLSSFSESENREHEISPKVLVQHAIYDAGEHRYRARNMEIEITLDDGDRPLTGCYSGALSPTTPWKPDGAGIIKFDNGDMYVGLMQDGQMHGCGSLVHRGKVLRGEFEHNMFVERTM